MDRDITDDDIRGLLATTGPLGQRDVWVAANDALGLDHTGTGREISSEDRVDGRRYCALELTRRNMVAEADALLDRDLDLPEVA